MPNEIAGENGSISRHYQRNHDSKVQGSSESTVKKVKDLAKRSNNVK